MMIIILLLATPSLNLEPTGILYVCPGGSLAVNCSTNATLMRWSIKFTSQQSPRPIETLQVRGPITTTMLTVNSVTLNISLVTNMPLLSTLSTNNLTSQQNRGSIICSELNGGTQDSVQIMLVTAGNVNSKLSNATSFLFTNEHLTSLYI